MTMLPLAAVDWDAVLQVAWVSLVAGVGATSAYAIAIFGLTRAVDLSRSGRPAEAGLLAVAGLAALVVVAGAVVLGIVAMTDK